MAHESEMEINSLGFVEFFNSKNPDTRFAAELEKTAQKLDVDKMAIFKAIKFLRSKGFSPNMMIELFANMTKPEQLEQLENLFEQISARIRSGEKTVKKSIVRAETKPAYDRTDVVFAIDYYKRHQIAA